MSACSCIDTFPAFLNFWTENGDKPIEDQIDAWVNDYMSRWPELLKLQQDNYAEDNLDWRHIAREKVFPFLPERFSALNEAHDNLMKNYETIYHQTEEKLAFQGDVVFVFYVGIGCGAGWYTPFRDTPALLFGLENIAECDWSDQKTIKGLIAHEIGHMVHRIWRKEAGKSEETGPWWQLYEEGFAERCENLILETESFHQTVGDPGWVEWCRSYRQWLAGEFLKTVEANESVDPFFGSWYQIQGRIETGYYLGNEVVQELEKDMSIREIALLEDIEKHIRSILEKMSKS